MSRVTINTTKYIVEIPPEYSYDVLVAEPPPIKVIVSTPVIAVTVTGLVGNQGIASGYFTSTLPSGLTHLITAATHGLTQLRGANVLKPVTRAEVEVYDELRLNNDVYLESNIDLLNHILIIY